MQTIHKRIIILTLIISLGLMLLNALSTLLGMFELSAFLFNLIDALGFHPGKEGLQQYPWGIISYPWVHYEVIPLLLNLLLLWTIGELFLKEYRGAALLSIYLGGATLGASFYGLACYIASLIGATPSILTLFGSSASICALCFALAVSQPNMRVQVPVIGSANLLAVIIVLYALSAVLSASHNWGGMMAHLGGAVYGIVWGLCRLRGYKDYPTTWIECLLDYLHHKQQKYKVHQPFNTRPTAEQVAQFRKNYKKDEELERILTKIRYSGYSSLSDAEQAYLKKTKD